MENQENKTQEELLKQAKETTNSTLGCLFFVAIIVGVFLFFYFSGNSDSDTTKISNSDSAVVISPYEENYEPTSNISKTEDYSSSGSNGSYDSDANPCLMSEDFIKQELNYPKEASFPFLDCHSTDNGGGKYTVLRKISTKNAYGMEKDYIYKVELRYKGGISVDIDNWELISIRHEEVR